MKIKAILNTFTSKPDLYGNTYTYAQATNTRTGESCSWITHSAGNASAELKKTLGLDFGEFTHNEVLKVPIRDFNRDSKGLPFDHEKELAKVFNKIKVEK